MIFLILFCLYKSSVCRFDCPEVHFDGSQTIALILCFPRSIIEVLQWMIGLSNHYMVSTLGKISWNCSGFWVLKSSSWKPEYENIKNTETTEIQPQCRCPPQSFLKKDPTRHSKNQPCFTQDFRMILPVSLCVPSLAVRFSGWFLIRFHFPCVRKRISSSDSSNF